LSIFAWGRGNRSDIKSGSKLADVHYSLVSVFQNFSSEKNIDIAEWEVLFTLPKVQIM
jgi:hypothetical protein